VRSRIVTDEVVREDLEAHREGLEEHSEIPLDYSLTLLEWREIEEKIRSGNFLQLHDPEFVPSRSRRK